jgi:hypothetical protein
MITRVRKRRIERLQSWRPYFWSTYSDRPSKLTCAQTPRTKNSIICSKRALEVLTNTQYNDFEIIRHIRNAFAHTGVRMTFTTTEVSDLCDELSYGDADQIMARVGMPAAARELMPSGMSNQRYVYGFAVTMLSVALESYSPNAR